jgi:hypothetical protein
MAYSLSYSNAIVSEGSPVTITLSNTGLTDGTLVPFVISGTGITTYDFLNLTSLTGNFIIRNGVGTITLTPAQDLKTEGTESFILRLTGTGRSESIGITILDTSTPSNATAQFYITTSAPTVDEGVSLTFTVRGVNVAAGTPVAYQIYGIQSADVYNTALTGNLIFTANSSYDTTANITLTTVKDYKTEGTENIAMLIYPTFSYSLVVSGTTSLIDTSTDSSGYLKITTDKTKVREGESITFTIEGVNIPTGSNVRYQIIPKPYTLASGKIISPELDDFSNLTSFIGTFPSLTRVGSANVASVTFNLKDDYVFEPTEYFYLTATPSSLYSPVSSALISILDSGNILVTPNQVTSGNVSISFLEKAILEANVGALTNNPGYWIDTTGQVSDAMVLQGKSLDATEQSLVLYQPFSYVIRSSLSIDKWKESVKTVLHPAGFALFSEINNETDPNHMNDASIVSPNDSEIFTYSTTTVDSTIGFFNVSNITYTNAVGTFPSTVDTIFLQTNPK